MARRILRYLFVNGKEPTVGRAPTVVTRDGRGNLCKPSGCPKGNTVNSRGCKPTERKASQRVPALAGPDNALEASTPLGLGRSVGSLLRRLKPAATHRGLLTGPAPFRILINQLMFIIVRTAEFERCKL